MKNLSDSWQRMSEGLFPSSLSYTYGGKKMQPMSSTSRLILGCKRSVKSSHVFSPICTDFSFHHQMMLILLPQYLEYSDELNSYKWVKKDRFRATIVLVLSV